MSTFGIYTGRIDALSPWEREYKAAAGRFHGFGNTPSQQDIECWERESNYWINGYVRNYLNTMVRGTPDALRWLGTMICPKPDPWGRHVLYDVYSQVDPGALASGRGPVRPDGVAIARTGFAPAAYSFGLPEGYGYFDNGYSWASTRYGSPGGEQWSGGYRLWDAENAGFARTHTPHGVAHKGMGAGSVLYAGLALAALDAGFKGNYSVETTRSDEATMLWKSGRNPRAGPLVTRERAAMKRMADGSADESVRQTHGYPGHCPDEYLNAVPNVRAIGCTPRSSFECGPTTTSVTRTGYVQYDYIDLAGLKRWGLTVFHAPVIEGKGARASFKATTDRATGVVTPPNPADDPYLIRSEWKNDDVKRAFGMRVAPSTLTSQGAAMQKHSHLLSDAGLEMLSRASVGPSTALIVKIAATLQGRRNDLAVAFLSREDIASVLTKTGAGKAILASMGAGTPLQGLGKAAFRDIVAAANDALERPTQLTLPTLSRSTESFIQNYPDEG